MFCDTTKRYEKVVIEILPEDFKEAVRDDPCNCLVVQAVRRLCKVDAVVSDEIVVETNPPQTYGYGYEEERIIHNFDYGNLQPTNLKFQLMRLT